MGREETRQRRIQSRTVRRTERHLAPPRESDQGGRNGVLDGRLPRRAEFCDDFASIRHENALAGPDLPNVLAQAVLELSKAHGFHVIECSSMKPHCQRRRAFPAAWLM